jgi:hypothetical protein
MSTYQILKHRQWGFTDMKATPAKYKGDIPVGIPIFPVSDALSAMR